MNGQAIKSVMLVTLLLQLFVFQISDVSASETVQDWTVLIYLSGDNNLESFQAAALTRLKTVNNSSRVNILVKMDGRQTLDSKMVLVKKYEGKNDKSIILEENVEYDMGDPETLSSFVEFGLKNYPAKKTALIIFSHGNGIVHFPENVTVENDPTGAVKLNFSPDDMDHSFIQEEKLISKLLPVLKKYNSDKKLDLLIFEACLMGNMEALSILAPVADNVIASEFSMVFYMGADYFDPFLETGENTSYNGIGINIQKMAQDLVAAPETSAKKIGERLVNYYHESYFAGQIDYYGGGPETFYESTLVLYDLKHMGKLNKMVNQVSIDFINLTNENPEYLDFLYLELMRIHMVDVSGYIDLGVIMRSIFSATKLTSAKDVLGFLKEELLISKMTVLHVDEFVSGLSIFFPLLSMRQLDSLELVEKYNQRKISHEIGWYKFLKNFNRLFYDNRDFTIHMDLLISYLQGNKLDIAHPAMVESVKSDSGRNYHHIRLLEQILPTQFLQDLQNKRFDKLTNHLKIVVTAKDESKSFQTYKYIVHALLTKSIDQADSEETLKELQTLIKILE